MSRARGDAGYALAALLAAITILLIGLGVAAPSWRYVMQDDREEELIFRGGQIADAVARYQKKNGNALPTSLEVLVKGRFLRKEWKEPFAKDGRWRFLRQGEGIGPVRPPGSPQPPTTTRPPGPGVPTGGPGLGGFIGVASFSTDKSLRLFNGRQRYNEWLFAAGQPRVVGKQAPMPGVPPGNGPGVPGRPPTLPGDPGQTPEQPDLP